MRYDWSALTDNDQRIIPATISIGPISIEISTLFAEQSRWIDAYFWSFELQTVFSSSLWIPITRYTVHGRGAKRNLESNSTSKRALTCFKKDENQDDV